VADVQILRAPASVVPSSYTLPDAAELRLKAVYADFTDNGAASDWLPTVTILSDSGDVIARAADQDVKVAAGASASVSWFPRVRRKRGATALGSQCTLLGSGNGNTTLTIPLTKAVPDRGILQVIFNAVRVAAPDNVPSAPLTASDSNAVPGWVVTTAVEPLIGLTADASLAGPPFDVAQCGSVARPCTAADLGSGSTVTVTFQVPAAGALATSGLVVYQNAYFFAVQQYGAFQYSNNDSYPSVSANPKRLSWFDDYGHNTTQPDYDAVMITAMGAYPAQSGFTPLDGFKVGEIASGTGSIACACKPVPEFTDIDPGGTWPSNASLLVGNYQYARPRPYH
jgi:hypothetical protein